MIKNIDLLNPLKKERIIKGLEFIQKQNEVESVIGAGIIFGSALTNQCTEESDIDICLASKYDCRNNTFFYIYGGLSLIMDNICDIVIYNKIKGKLKNEINKKGVVVYEY